MQKSEIFDKVEDCIADFAAGKIVIVADDESRENEGDMIVAVNGQDLDDTELLTSIIEDSSAGDALTLSMVRINTDYSLTEFDVTVRLVADMGSATVEETEPETTARIRFATVSARFFLWRLLTVMAERAPMYAE